MDTVCNGLYRPLLVNSGASHHLMSYKDLTAKKKKMVRDKEYPLPLRTANGIVYANKKADVFVRS